VHREHRDRRFRVLPRRAIDRAYAQLEYEKVQAVLLPGIEVVVVGQAVPNRRELGRSLQRPEERGVGAGQGIADRVLGDDPRVQIGRTGRGGIPSAAARWFDDDRLKRAHDDALLAWRAMGPAGAP
jgi:hypothetical protein